MSIRLRLTAWYTCILAVTLILFGSAVYGVVHYNTYSDLKKKLVDQRGKISPSYIINLSRGQMTFDIELDGQDLQGAQIFGRCVIIKTAKSP
ncbi:hypothetical protein CM49_05836 [Paenibacillus sp. P1XP2]|nr:hypothetical protein CM49_05836 [Paenibacillus sp. P1XP2]